MREWIFDAGAYLAELRAVAQPDVVRLANFAGNANESEKADLYWEEVQAVTFTLAAGIAVATRLPRLRFLDGDGVPFAAVQAQVGVTAGNTSLFSFVRGVFPAGVANSSTIVVPLPELMLLPNWSIALDVPGGAVADTVSGVRVARQLFQPIRLVEQLSYQES